MISTPHPLLSVSFSTLIIFCIIIDKEFRKIMVDDGLYFPHLRMNAFSFPPFEGFIISWFLTFQIRWIIGKSQWTMKQTKKENKNSNEEKVIFKHSLFSRHFRWKVLRRRENNLEKYNSVWWIFITLRWRKCNDVVKVGWGGKKRSNQKLLTKKGFTIEWWIRKQMRWRKQQ